MFKNFFKRKITIVTHNGTFHPDDVFSIATLFLLLEDKYRVEVIRTRDFKLIEKADYVVDVGFIYDEKNNRFDHHQPSGAGFHKNFDIPLASFGLVWNKFGEAVCGSLDIKEGIENKLTVPIDALDNGIEISKSVFEGIRDYSILDVLSSFKDDNNIDQSFLKSVDFAKEILKREISIIKDKINDFNYVKDVYSKSIDKRLLILDKDCSFNEFVYSNLDILLVIYPSKYNGTWHIRSANNLKDNFDNRILFPVDWRGKKI